MACDQFVKSCDHDNPPEYCSQIIEIGISRIANDKMIGMHVFIISAREYKST